MPRADVLVVTYSPAEGHALADVLTPGWPLPRWYPYRNGWQRLKRTSPEGRDGLNLRDGRGVSGRKTDRAGLWATARVGTSSVVLVKTDLHPSTDGGLELQVELWRQVIDQVQPRLVITTGSATGTGPLDLGDVAVSRHLSLPGHGEPPGPEAAEEFVSSAPLSATRLALVQTKLLPDISSMLPQAPRAPRIWTDTRTHPVSVVTAPTFGADLNLDPTRRRNGQVVVDTTDAALALACAQLTTPPPWVSVRAVAATSPGHGQPHPDRGHAAASHEQFAYATCLGSALACWGLIR